MKKILLVLAILLSFQGFAQSFGKGSTRVHAGIGIGSPYISSGTKMGVPPIHASFELGVTDKIGVGGLLGYTSSSIEEQFFTTSYSWKFSYLIVGARGAYHFLTDDKMDLYGGLMLGYNIANARFESNDSSLNSFVTEPTAGGVAYGFFAGGRYNLKNNLAVFAELGYSISWISAGVCFNIK